MTSTHLRINTGALGLLDYSDFLDPTALQAIWPQRFGCAITVATYGTYGFDSHVALLFFIMLAVLIPLIGYIVYRCTPQKPDTPGFAVFHPGDVTSPLYVTPRDTVILHLPY